MIVFLEYHQSLKDIKVPESEISSRKWAARFFFPSKVCQSLVGQRKRKLESKPPRKKNRWTLFLTLETNACERWDFDRVDHFKTRNTTEQLQRGDSSLTRKVLNWVQAIFGEA